MGKKREELKKMVYDLMNGSLELDLCSAPEKELVADEYVAVVSVISCMQKSL